MSRLKISMCCVFCLLMAFRVTAQDKLKQDDDEASRRDSRVYIIYSLEGKKCAVRTLPHYPLEVLKICYQKDTIIIGDYWGVPADIKVLGKTFLEIDYAIRAGSNVGAGHTLLFCIRHHRLRKCMYVMQYTNGDAAGEQDDYHINLSLKGDNIQNYKLNASVTDKVQSKYSPEENYNYHNLSVLSFDAKNYVFYSIKKGLFEEYEIQDEEGKTKKQKLHGYYPEIILGEDNYYYVNDNWYSMYDGKKLFPVVGND